MKFKTSHVSSIVVVVNAIVAVDEVAHCCCYCCLKFSKCVCIFSMIQVATWSLESVH